MNVVTLWREHGTKILGLIVLATWWAGVVVWQD